MVRGHRAETGVYNYVFCKVIPEWSLPLHSGSTLREVKGQVLLAMICLMIPTLSLLLFIQSLYSISKLQIFYLLVTYCSRLFVVVELFLLNMTVFVGSQSYISPPSFMFVSAAVS